MAIQNALERFIYKSTHFRRAMDEYTNIRKILFDEGFTQLDASSMTKGPRELFLARDRFIDHYQNLSTQIKLFFPKETNFGIYIKRVADKIDELYPLKNDSEERDN